ncbi:MAG: Brp/Blh family beta-carotene 15,15'-dioxygenase, partial [Planctomycetota bacterium]
AAGFGRMGLFFGAMGVAQPAEVARVGEATAGFFTAGAPATVRPTEVVVLSLTLLTVAAAAWVAGLVVQTFRSEPKSVALRIDVAETLALTGLAIWLDPLFVVGLYFLGWHAPRRIAQQLRDAPELVASADRSASAARALGGSLWRYHRRTAWLWLPIWPAWALWVWAVASPDRVEAWALGLIALFVVLTPVHHALGERREVQRTQTAA